MSDLSFAGIAPFGLSDPDFYAAFSPQVFHTRVFRVFLGADYVGDRVTGLNGEDSEAGQTFQFVLADGVSMSGLMASYLAAEPAFFLPVTVVASYRDNRSRQFVASETILTGKVDKLSFSRGGRSSSLVVYCRGLAQPRAASVTHQAIGVEYHTSSNTSQSIRLPAQLDYRVGDRVVFSDGDFFIKRISYTIDTTGAVMTVSG